MRKSIRILRLVLLAPLALAAAAGAVGVGEIPSPRPAGWTVDLTGTLPADTRSALDRLGDEVKAQTGAEMAVVVVGTTGGVEPRAFATQLLNRWGIGERGRSNGLLVFAALDDHAAEIVLGDGVDDADREALSAEVMQGEMVPRLRAGDPAGAVLHGAVACARRILGAAPTAADAAGNLQVESPVPDAAPLASAPPPAAAAAEPPAPKPIATAPLPEPLSPFAALPILWIAGGVLFGLGALVWGKIRPRRPRKCPKCGLEMLLLEEDADDAELSRAERIEERIGSVDYDVWACRGCNEFLKVGHGALFTRYARCPGCGARTKSSASSVLRSASEYEEGLVEVEESCVNCDYRTRSTHSTPRLQPRARSFSSSSSWSSAGSSSSSSSAGSSSSSGSSSGFGGGHSSGGGASGRW